jgi:hypothetical protein
MKRAVPPRAANSGGVADSRERTTDNDEYPI